MSKPTIVVIAIVITLLCILVDSSLPLFSMKIPITEAITIRVAVYDINNGFTRTVFNNFKTVLTFWREMK